MRVLAASLFFALLAIRSANASEPVDRLESYITAFSSVDGFPSEGDELVQLAAKFREKQLKVANEIAFVDLLFSKTRQRFLRNYAEYASFSETLGKGTYNCLTGTAVYALLLEHFEIPYQIIETNYHIFLIACTDNGRVLLEATDGQSGFVTGEENINARVREYRQGLPSGNQNDKAYYKYDANLFKQVSLDELTGLLYYNRAIVAYNEHDLSGAVDHLVRSAGLYHSARTQEFATILQITVSESNLEYHQKEHHLKEIQQLRANGVVFRASID